MDFGANLAPFWEGFGVQVGTKINQKSFKKSIITFERKLEPTWSHIGPTYAPLGPNFAQLGPNLGPTWSQNADGAELRATICRFKIDYLSLNSVIAPLSVLTQFWVD